MLNQDLLAEAVAELASPLKQSPEADRAIAASFVASSLQLEGIASTPESVLAAVDRQLAVSRTA